MKREKSEQDYATSLSIRPFMLSIDIEFILPQIHCDKPLSAIWKLRLTQANDKITINNVNSKNNNLSNNSREFISFENY